MKGTTYTVVRIVIFVITFYNYSLLIKPVHTFIDIKKVYRPITKTEVNILLSQL